MSKHCYLLGFELRDYAQTLSREKSYPTHQSKCQMDFWSSSYDIFVHYLFTICSLFVHYFIIRSLFVHYLFIICSLFHNSFIICSLFVHYSFIICSLFHNSFIICSLFVHYSLIIRSLFIHYLLSFVHYLFIICSLFLRNRVNLRFHYCLPN